MTNLSSPREVYETFSQSVLSRTSDWKALVADDVKLKSPLISLVYKSKFVKVYELFYRSVLQSEVRHLIEHGDFVITQVTTTFETSNNEVSTLRMNQWFTIRNGLIVDVAIYYDASVLAALDQTSSSVGAARG